MVKLFLLYLFIFTINVYSQQTYTQEIGLLGTGSEETDYIMRVDVHRGVNTGDYASENIFLNNFCKTDYGDVRFYDSDGSTVLDYYILNQSDFEIIHKGDGKIKIVHSDGSIYASGVEEGYISKSTDNESTWTTLYDSGNSTTKLAFVDSSSNVFFTEDYQLYRSRDLTYENWDVVIDMTDVDGIVERTSFIEDSSGDLYAGRYQTQDGVQIWKSTDNGSNWASSFTDATKQHVHAMEYDEYTGYIYVGIEDTDPASGSALLRSVDNGDNWTYIKTSTSADARGIYCGDGFRIFGGGASGIGAGGDNEVFRTTNDTDYTTILEEGLNFTAVEKIGDSLYTFGAAVENEDKYAKVWQSKDNGVTWDLIWVSNYVTDTTFGVGWEWDKDPGTPTGETEDQYLMSWYISPFQSIRFYDGGTHSQALFYVLIPTLPAEGKSIYVKCGDSSLSSASSIDSFPTLLTDIYSTNKLNTNDSEVVQYITTLKNCVLRNGVFE